MFARLMTPAVLLATGPAALLAAPVNPAPPAKPAASLPLSSTDALAGSLRGYLVRHLPTTLYEASPGWGHQRRGFRGVKWHGKVLPLRPAVQRGDENQGVWKKIKLTAVDLPNTLVFDLRNVRKAEDGPATFDLFVSFDARVEYTQQNWEAGLKLLDVSARARLRVKLALSCEVTTRVEAGNSLLPEVVFHLHVTRADLRYDNFVMEHLAGLGGDAAKLFGKTLKDTLHELRPSVEREMLTRADAAIVKAADNKEVRISLGGLLGGKGLVPAHK